MKTLNLLSKGIIFLSLAACILLFNSYKSGVSGNSTNGCTPCHGSKSASTIITLVGIPTTGAVKGQTYPLILSVTNPSNVKGGFDLSVSGGTLAAGSGSKLSNNDLTHTAPLQATSGTSVWNFTWTAPATLGQVTFNVSGNATNGDGNATASDSWNSSSFVYDVVAPQAISNSALNDQVNIYPNPALNVIHVDGVSTLVSAVAYDFMGRTYPLEVSYPSKGVDVSMLNAGIYILALDTKEGKVMKTFVKQ